jgi:hypothetical protein
MVSSLKHSSRSPLARQAPTELLRRVTVLLRRVTAGGQGRGYVVGILDLKIGSLLSALKAELLTGAVCQIWRTGTKLWGLPPDLFRS